MTATQKRRCWIISLVIVAVALAVSLVLYALQQNISLFYSPSQIVQGEAPQGQMIRVGGLVAMKSVQHGSGLKVSFVITDNQQQIPVDYDGILPDLFREGQGIVVQGKLDTQGRLQATQVLAKHDENYMPPEVAESLKPTSLSKE